MRKMKHADNQINLCPILFPISLFFCYAWLEQTNVADALLV